jgi:hypothetical protein
MHHRQMLHLVRRVVSHCTAKLPSQPDDDILNVVSSLRILQYHFPRCPARGTYVVPTYDIAAASLRRVVFSLFTIASILRKLHPLK